MLMSTRYAIRSGLVVVTTLLGCFALVGTGNAVAAGPSCPTLTYHSAPALKAQRACENLGVTTHGTQPGRYLFLTQNGASGAGAGIFQDNGSLVWWLSTNGVRDHDMSVVQYQGQPYIALWTGKSGSGSYGMGSVTLYNEHYQVAGHISISGAYGAQGIDLHEFQITPEGDALVGSYTPFWMFVQKHWEWVLGYLVEKWSLVRDSSGIHVGKLLFAWNAIHDVPLSDSHLPNPGYHGAVYDYFHGNGITEAPDGNLLVSARNTWGIYEISDRPGTKGYDHVYWQVGAPHDSKLAQPWCYQHDIAPLGHGTYSLYDDGGIGPGCQPGSSQHPARGVIFSVNASRRPVQVSLVRSYAHSPSIYTGFTGSMQVLGNGDALVDWADVPEITEFASNGSVNMDLSLSGFSYRGVRYAWDGQPTQPPAVASQRAGIGTTVWASWNGSTEVAAWRVLGGPDASHLSPVGQPFTKSGFETTMSVSGQYAKLAVQALNSSGAVLSTSNPISG
jgi:hypothetical protein